MSQTDLQETEHSSLPQPGTEGSWEYSMVFKGGARVPLTLTEEILRQEISDQCSIKSAARKAILRTTWKRLQKKLHPTPTPSPGNQAWEAIRWDAFILYVDTLIANRHLKLRTDESLITDLVEKAQNTQ